ncbi:hypothetical protein PHISP_07500 [Aspergillus sp. HF37]|nr:hypothetical protein PHISP_07500 [Aspergillus sp. HF37]
MHSATLLGFLLFSTVWASKMTQIGLSVGEASRSVHVPLDDCHDLDEEYVLSWNSRTLLMY